MSKAFDFAIGRAKGNWNYTHARGPVAWLLRKIGFLRPVDGVWICRHADGDWDAARIVGDPQQIWRYDGDGLKIVDALPSLDLKSSASKTPVLRFCVDETGQRMIYAEWHGVRAGTTLVLRANDADWCTVEKRAWMS